MRLFIVIPLVSSFVLAAAGAELVMPPVIERDAPVTVVYRTAPQATGKGVLEVAWTDILGRTVDQRSIPVVLTDETEIRFPLDACRAVAMANELRVRFRFEGTRKNGAADRRDETAVASFVAKPSDRQWWDYMIMMWQPHSAERTAVMRQVGINGGQYSGRAKTPPDFLLENNLRWYAENIATDFYSEYHRYRPDRIQQWSWLQAKEMFRKDPSSLEAFKRHPSLSDPAWLSTIRERLMDAARVQSPYRPVFYDLADESGIADLASFWDFDFSDHSLAEMRTWLKERYATLDALNAQWGSTFAAWEQVVPDTTRQAMARTDENYSAWSDHKEWMDESFARAIRMGVDAIRSVDPDAYAGIAGGQMPGWGGYDYWKLSRALTAIEPYDIGNNIEMLRSFAPQTPFVTTAFARGPWEKHRLWYELLHGARGHIIWDDKHEIAPDATKPGPRGAEVAPYYTELRSGIAAQLIASKAQSGPVAIHYSQSSMRVEWMIAQRPKGDAWVDRTSKTERLDSEFLRLRESYCKLIEDLGLQYRFVSYAQVERGELLRGGYRVLILPRSSALSAAEAEEIRSFAARGGVVVADGEPGVFDEHARRLAAPRLAGVPMTRWDAHSYHQDRLLGKEGPFRREALQLFDKAGATPAITVHDSGGGRAFGVETFTWRNGAVTILALLTNPEQRVDELGPPEFQSNQRFEKTRELTVALPGEAYVYDVRTGKALGRRHDVRVALDPYEPAVFAIAPEPAPELLVSAPRQVAAGDIAQVAVRFERPWPADVPVLHVDVIDPSGIPRLDYSGNVLAPNGAASKTIPLAVNDAAGKWEVRVHDLLTGQRKIAYLQVNQPAARM